MDGTTAMKMLRGFRLGRLAGVEIRIDVSLVVVFLLVATSLAGGVLPAWHPDWTGQLRWIVALTAAVLFFASILVHELSHALVGRSFGVVVRRITLFMLGGMAEMEGEPPSWRAELAMAIAGPLTSLGLGIGFTALARAFTGPILLDPAQPQAALAALGPLATLLFWLGPVNVVLGLFNLVPGFPLDGGRVLRALAWAATGSLRRATRIASASGRAFGFLLVAMGLWMAVGMRIPFFGTGLVSGIWLVLVGWFLASAAALGYRQLVVQEALEDVQVSRIMLSRLARITPDLSVGRFIDDVVAGSAQLAFPVERDGVFLGLVMVGDLHDVARQAWEETPVERVMRPAAQLPSVGPRTTGAEALRLLASRQVNQLPVLDDGRLLGLLRREDVLQWLALHPDRLDEGGGHGVPIAHHR